MGDRSALHSFRVTRTLASAFSMLSFGTPFARAFLRTTANAMFSAGSTDPPPVIAGFNHLILGIVVKDLTDV